MYRDERDAMVQRLDSLSRESEALRRQNAEMREEILHRSREGATGLTPYAVYQGDIERLSRAQRAALAFHQVQPFPVWATALLSVFTFGLFPLIHFGLLHDKLPKATESDPSAGKAIGFSFIPYFNLYWVFFNTLRLADRLNLQFRLRGLPPEAPKGLLLACCIVWVIPYVNIFIGLPILWTIGNIFLQLAVNKVARLDPLVAWNEYQLSQGGQGGGVPPSDPFARPPPGLIR